MKIIGIDSSGMTASVAIGLDDKILAEYSVNDKKTHSQTLLPMLEEIMRMTGTEGEEIDAIAVAAGPGSFTGLRIGAATAKGLGLAWEKPLIAVSTLEAMAWQFAGDTRLVCPMMDARRAQVYTALYRWENGRMQPVVTPCAVAVEEILSKINDLGESVVLLGDGAGVYRAMLEEKLGVPYFIAPPHLNCQNAGALCVCAAGYYDRGETVSADQFTPDYLRVSQAERERAMKQETTKT